MRKLSYILLIPAIILFAGCGDKDVDPPSGGQLALTKKAGPVPSLETGAWVDLLVYVEASGGAPPYRYGTSLSGDFTETLERRLPDAVGEKQYAVYVEDSAGTRVQSPVVVTINVVNPSVPNPDNNTVPAFEGAEGGGMYTTGGRGGKVLYVTSLEDGSNSTTGTLRWALSQSGPRIVMFKVSGQIILKSNIYVANGDLTIAGQSAPGDGICVRRYSIIFRGDNTIVRFIRFRLGDEAYATGTNPNEMDAAGAVHLNNLIIDHCSMSWSTDECASFYGNNKFTMQWCIMGESLRQSYHPKGTPHGYGGIWGGKDASFHHNLLTCHDSRNPRFDHEGGYNSMGIPLADYRGNVDFRNNVIYNWGGNNTYGGEGGHFNMIGNFYKEGPASRQRKWFIQTYGNTDGNDYGHPRLYMDGNRYMARGGAMNESLTLDNWNGVVNYADGGSTTGMRLGAELEIGGKTGGKHTTTHTAEDAFDLVMAKAGAWPRDVVDIRYVNDARTQTATYMTGGDPARYPINDNMTTPSANGLIDTQDIVGGWPVYNSAAAPADTDGDGMPDEWEDAKGLNKNNASDGAAKTLSPQTGYTNLDVYLNELAAGLIDRQ